MDGENGNKKVATVGKKRKRDPDKYERNTRKEARLSGDNYKTCKGISVSPKKQGPPCNCRKKCYNSLPTAELKNIWDRFYTHESKNQQDTFLQDLIAVAPIERRRLVNEERTRAENKANFIYQVRTSDGKLHRVCFKAFVSIFGLKKKRIERLRSLATSGKSPNDERGKTPSNSLPPETVEIVKKHIESFPTEISHYVSVSYLPSSLTVEKMYTLFKLKNPMVKISYSSYLRIFNYNFKLSFGQPQIDTCGLCEEYNVKMKNKAINDSVKQKIVAEKMVHLRRSKMFHSSIKKDRDAKDESVLSICFDYMANISLPKIPVQEAYYKRQLTVNVFCVHNIQKNKSRMYVYHEGTAKKGPDEVCSFLYDYIMDEVAANPNKYQVLHLYSDNCGGQNKNHAVIKFMQALSDNRMFQECRFYFPLRGHSFNDCDRDFALIKRQLKQRDRIYTLREIVEIITASGIGKFEVVTINNRDILDFKNWWPQYYRKCTISEETKDRPRSERIMFAVQQFFHFASTSELPGVIVTRPFIDGIQQHSFLSKQAEVRFPIPFPTKKAYKHKICLNKDKLKDIKDLMIYVPVPKRKMYEKLK